MMPATALAKPASVTLDDERVVPGITDAATLSAHIARYELAAPMLTPRDVLLETACGSGYGTRMLAARAGSVVAVDYSQVALAHARAHHAAANIRYLQMDCHHLAFPDASFDKVISFEVFEHLEDPQRYLRECSRVLRAGGQLILSTPNAASWGIHMQGAGLEYEFHINMMDLETLRRALARNFCRVLIYGQRRRGSRVYGALRALDVFNLRLRLLSHRRRERMQQSLGVTPAAQIRSVDWMFSRGQLRQAHTFLAVCSKA
jgi:SAM-dependent methyltransferase